MRVLTLVCLGACLAFVLLTTRPVCAASSGDLVRAREAFQRGDYATAIPLLSVLLYPTPKLSSRSELSEAHLMLGVSQFETDNADEARAEFDRALRQDAGLQLDPMFVSRKAVDFFEKEKADFKRRAAAEDEKRRLAEERDAYRRALESLIVVEKRPYYVNFIPFGAGQFQNGDNGKGIFFSAAESVTGGVSMLIFGYHAVKYGFGGKVPRDEAGTVRRTQQIQIGAGIACLGLMAWGIVDSLMHYQGDTQRKADESDLPEDFRLRPRPNDNRRPRTHHSLRLVPTIAPGAVGLGLSWGF